MRKALLWPAIIVPFIATLVAFACIPDDLYFLTAITIGFLIGWPCLGFYRTEETVLKWICFGIYPFLCLGLPYFLLLVMVGMAMR